MWTNVDKKVIYKLSLFMTLLYDQTCLKGTVPQCSITVNLIIIINIIIIIT